MDREFLKLLLNTVSVSGNEEANQENALAFAKTFADKQMSDPVNTAVVLPDENLLFPMLGSIPARIPDVNVTMGYPLSASSGVSLFQILERLQQNKRQRDGLWCFYHRDVINLLEHPYLAAASDPSVVASIKDGILKNKSIFVPVSDLSGNLLFPVLFKPVEGTQEIPGYLKEIIEGLQSFQSPVEREFLSHFHQAVSALENAGLHLDELLPRTWYRLLSQCIGLVKIPFEGEPLKGLQIMGPLETRALDFDNIIILSVNEGTFPSRTVSSSFIPYILRKGFGLPTFERQDAIWAYYFYRYYLRLGFLDGREGKIFCFMQAYWYRFLVDAKIYESERAKKGKTE